MSYSPAAARSISVYTLRSYTLGELASQVDLSLTSWNQSDSPALV